MKKLFSLYLLAAALWLPFTIEQGCKTPPSSRVIQVQTLQAVGEAARGAMDAATALLKDGKITVTQWQGVADLYDHRFQPVYALAVSAVNADLSTLASPDLASLAQQLVQTVATLVHS